MTTGTARGDGFGARLVAALAGAGPLCPGLDPSAQVLAAWGLPDDATGLREFGYRVAEACHGLAGVVKPQVAFFERHGTAGFDALEAVLARCRDAGLLVIADAKRGDIGSTAAGYAQAWLSPGAPLGCDAVTLSGYLGYESLRPFVTAAVDAGRGVFVLALTSNPEGAQVQAARLADGRTVARAVADAAGADNLAAGAGPGTAPGPVGLVVGATSTVDPAAHDIDLAATHGCVLAPGYGTQGGDSADLARLFPGVGGRVAVVLGRCLLSEGPDVSAMRAALDRHRSLTSTALGR